MRVREALFLPSSVTLRGPQPSSVWIPCGVINQSQRCWEIRDAKLPWQMRSPWMAGLRILTQATAVPPNLLSNSPSKNAMLVPALPSLTCHEAES
jgi:hypothetical protein